MTVDNPNESPFLNSVTNCWLDLEPSLLTHGVRCEIRRSDVHGKLGIEIRSTLRLALIEAWEREHCVDVTIMNLTNSESTILSAGPCNSTEEMESRLLAVCEALTNLPSAAVNANEPQVSGPANPELKKYDAIVWLGENPGQRVTILAKDYKDARKQIEASHGDSVVATITNEDDARRPR